MTVLLLIAEWRRSYLSKYRFRGFTVRRNNWLFDKVKCVKPNASYSFDWRVSAKPAAGPVGLASSIHTTLFSSWGDSVGPR